MMSVCVFAAIASWRTCIQAFTPPENSGLIAYVRLPHLQIIIANANLPWKANYFKTEYRAKKFTDFQLAVGRIVTRGTLRHLRRLTCDRGLSLASSTTEAGMVLGPVMWQIQTLVQARSSVLNKNERGKI
jgi:hypothetical protein